MMTSAPELTLKSIQEAKERIKGFVHRTPVLTSSSIDEIVGGGKELYFKCENFQKSGSFKILLAQKRGDIKNGLGVVTKSFGNHGYALAWAAKQVGIPAIVVIPKDAPPEVLERLKAYGTNIVFSETNNAAWTQKCIDVQKETGYYLVEPANDLDVMSGQGTIALELIEQVPNLDAIIVSVGGGGMVSGIGTYAKSTNPHIKVFCAEPEGKKLQTSLQTGVRVQNTEAFIDTIADALKVPSLFDKCFEELRKGICDKTIFSINNQEIASAMKLIYERMKIIIDPSAALGLAAVLKYPDELKNFKRIGIVLCGGNVDLMNLPF